MAKLIQNNNKQSQPQPVSIENIIALILVFLAGIVCIISFINTMSVFSIVLGCVLLIIGFVASKGLKPPERNFDSLKRYGAEGERQAGYLLEAVLPDDYTIIQNAIVSYNGGQSEIDNIVIGKAGVFIIEVKNMKGDIFGNYQSQYWLKDKKEKYGINHQEEFYSPVKQVGTHIYRLTNFLKDNKIFIHINGAVYFIDPETNVSVNGKQNEIMIFTSDTTNSMIRYIMSGKSNLSDETIEKIIALLN